MRFALYGILALLVVWFLWKWIWKAIWHAVRFALWRPKLILLLVGAFIAYALFLAYSSPEGPLPPGTSLEGRASPPAGSPLARNGLPDPVTHPATLPPLPGPLKNGNSDFAPDMLLAMGKNGKPWYSREFYAAIEQTGSAPYLWQFSQGKFTMFGKIVPGERYQAPNGRTCRSYSEILVVGKQAQQSNGKACQASAGGWCKIRSESANTCDLAPLEGMDAFRSNLRRSLHRWF